MSLASTGLLALLGSPVSHSRSPALHSAALAATGIDATYLAFDVRPNRLPAAVAGLAAMGAVGANVTLPHKTAVMAHVEVVEPHAARVGAVNTLVRREDSFVGTNTDVPGLLRALEDAEVDPGGRRAVVLGAGGAARAAAVALAEAGSAHLTVTARRSSAARELLSSLRPTVPHETAPFDALEDSFARCDILIQATSATLADNPDAGPFASALPIDRLPPHGVVVDLVYAPLETTVLRRARAHGLTTIDGLGMLEWQAALAFSRWFGVKPPIDAMRAIREEI